MAQFTLDFGAKVDIASGAELRHEVDRIEEIWRSYATGLKRMRRAGVLGAPAGALPAPRQGFSWALYGVSVYASAAATVTVGLGETATYALALPQTLAAAGWAVFTWSSRQVILDGGDVLWVAASAGTLGRFMVQAVEAPAEQIFKLVGG